MKKNEKKAILVVSFGTSYSNTREKNIDAVEKYIAGEYPEYDVKRAFTSKMIIEKLKKEGITIDSPEEALEKLYKEGYSEVVCQPLHIINGFEYEKIVRAVQKYQEYFQCLLLGEPLLTGIGDYEKVVEVLKKEFGTVEKNQALVFMGHGTEHHSNAAYSCLENLFKDRGMERVYIGTVEGFPSIRQVILRLKKQQQINHVTLIPFMLVAGDHAQNDMLGESEKSWKNLLLQEDFQVDYILRGLGEIRGIQSIFSEHIEDVLRQK